MRLFMFETHRFVHLNTTRNIPDSKLGVVLLVLATKMRINHQNKSKGVSDSSLLSVCQVFVSTLRPWSE